MDFTTQAAIVAALLALLVLLGGLAVRDRRRRRAESAPAPATTDVVGEEAGDQAPFTVQAAEDPAFAEPVGEDPALEEPLGDELGTEAPAIEEPMGVATAADQVVDHEPVAEESMGEEPVAEEPAAEEPVEVPEADELPADVAVEEPAATETPARRGGFFSRRRRRRQAAASADLKAALAPYEASELRIDAFGGLEVTAAEDGRPEDSVVEEPADAPVDEQAPGAELDVHSELRSLRAQVRTLEETLQSQLADAPTGLAVVEPPAEHDAAYLRQVSLVVRGLAEHTDEQENPHRTLARVAAAVERLGVPNVMDRPVLPLPSDPPPHPRAGGPWKPTHRREVRELVAPAPQAEVVAFPGAQGSLADELVSLQTHGEVVHHPGPAAPTDAEPQLQPQVPAEPAPQVAAPQVAAQFAPAEPAPREMPQQMAQSLAESEPMPEPTPEPMPEATQAMELSETDPGLPTYGAVDVVLPVPPPAQPQPQPTRRRFRR